MEQSFQITIVCEDAHLTGEELKKQLTEYVSSAEARDLREGLRAIPDSTLASVVVVASAAIIRDVIRGLVAIALARERRKFSIQKSDGTRTIEVISEGTDIREIIEKLLAALDFTGVIRF